VLSSLNRCARIALTNSHSPNRAEIPDLSLVRAPLLLLYYSQAIIQKSMSLKYEPASEPQVVSDRNSDLQRIAPAPPLRADEDGTKTCYLRILVYLVIYDSGYDS